MRTLRSVSLLAIASCALSAHAAVIDFDDLDGSGYTFVNDYQGYTFAGLYSYSQGNNAADYANTYAFPSQANAIANAYGHNPTSFSSGTAFSFAGGYFGSYGYANDYAGYSATGLLIEGLRNGAVVGSVTTSLGANGLSYVATGFSNVDEVRFTGLGAQDPQFSYYFIDSLNVGAASAVPGPMAALPFALMALKRRKRA